MSVNSLFAAYSSWRGGGGSSGEIDGNEEILLELMFRTRILKNRQ